MANELTDNQLLELRRGTIVIATLSLLRNRQYGYGLLQALEATGVPIDAGTLYPLLRRLEKQGVLRSMWETSEARPRKYYWLSEEGEVLYRKLVEEWMHMNGLVQRLLKEDYNGNY